MNIAVFLDLVPQEYLEVKKTTTIRSIKSYLQKYNNIEKTQFLINDQAESKILDTDKYDNYNLSSIWKNLNNPAIYLYTPNQFKYASKDVILKIMDEMDDSTLLNFCKTNDQRDSGGVLYCNNEIFWENRLTKYYPLLLEFKKNDDTYKNFFIEMSHYISKLEEGFGIPYIPTEGYNPKELYNINSVKKEELGINYNERNIYNEAMEEAARGGQLEIIKLMIEKGANNFDRVMNSAARKGHMDIVKFMIDKATAYGFNWAMRIASIEGQMEIVKLMIENGADDFNNSMASAAKGGRMDIVKLMIENDADDFNAAMISAAKGGRMDIVKLMIENDADDFNTAMISAAKEGHMKIVKLMIENGADFFNWGMREAAIGGHMDIVKLMVENGADDFFPAILSARKRGHMDIVKYLNKMEIG